MAMSRVFQHMFTVDMRESRSNSVLITDFSSKSVHHFLEFLYVQRVSDTAMEDSMMDLWALGDKYQIPSLQSTIAHRCKSFVSNSNLKELMTFAESEGIGFMKTACVRFMLGYK